MWSESVINAPVWVRLWRWSPHASHNPLSLSLSTTSPMAEASNRACRNLPPPPRCYELGTFGLVEGAAPVNGLPATWFLEVASCTVSWYSPLLEPEKNTVHVPSSWSLDAHSTLAVPVPSPVMVGTATTSAVCVKMY